MELRPGAPYQRSGRPVLDGEKTETVLCPVALIAAERHRALLPSERASSHMAHEPRIGVPASQYGEIAIAPPTEAQSLSLDEGRVLAIAWLGHALLHLGDGRESPRASRSCVTESSGSSPGPLSPDHHRKPRSTRPGTRLHSTHPNLGLP